MSEAQDLLDVEATAVRLLAAREHSTFELRRKLTQRFGQGGPVERVLADLQRRNLLSDERFTEHYVALRTRKGYGPMRIRAELAERGIDANLADAWLDVGSSEWREQMLAVAQQRFGDSLAEDRKEQARRARFLAYRGFPEGLIRRYLWD